ncbi:MAG: crossover junction endodeoxyribonuclease RuvC [Bacillota bacterium]|nr:crossover junction endodeoxyribonuclease RuvC [Bacillota bacterium]
MMRIIGIDPGIAITGYGIIEERGSDYYCLESGCIRTSKDLESSMRLQSIFDQICALVDHHRPVALAIEKIFFSKNVRTAFQVGEARGVIILAAARCSLAVYEYTPLQVKQAVAGYGKAEKNQVQRMVQMLLRLKKIPAVDDEADAMAVALCHLQSHRWREAVKGGNQQ